MGELSRRGALRAGAIAGLGLGAAGAGVLPAAAEPDEVESPPARRGKSMIGVPFQRMDAPRFGIIGLGNRGASMLPLLLAVPNARVTALCDTRADVVRKAAKVVTDAGQPQPAQYSGGEEEYRKLCQRSDVDFVYVATPWEWHVPMSVEAMRGGKHVGVECPMGITVRDLWELVDTSEQTRKHCIQLENCVYGRNEMRVLRMAHAGKFGQLLHGAGAYLHDLRELLFSKTYYANQWRRKWHTRLDGDHYPTHGLGPVAAYMDIHRGDRLARITAMSTPALGLAEYRAAHMPAGDETWRERYVKGDVTQSLIQTERGRVIHVVHGVSGPHPYSRLNHLAGTKGVFEDYPPRIYLEPDASDHQWDPFDNYKSFDHWLWTDVGPGPGGHGGMDYIMLWRLVQCMRLGLPPDLDVYDSAATNAPFPLTVTSIRRGGAPVAVPDFTRGNWKTPHAGPDSPKP
ncbi:Gfo/Idh/MocA family protein [Amycolatopsis suaedae]|uniref:Glycosyl hydrolase family 109 protein n=1 Tax=Amycolatopsis suaedae TaxID=2510978 RepID=A0A4V2ELJ0_9PSEU|nr:Gfo/Idh/MocA family oxidoreductase [Amycolatopsis suaedae]RZQ61735.1 gfo/Idh/MocA family oxidoreductase [Amycolatopsis suaedae]